MGLVPQPGLLQMDIHSVGVTVACGGHVLPALVPAWPGEHTLLSDNPGTRVMGGDVGVCLAALAMSVTSIARNGCAPGNNLKTSVQKRVN